MSNVYLEKIAELMEKEAKRGFDKQESRAKRNERAAPKGPTGRNLTRRTVVEKSLPDAPTGEANWKQYVDAPKSNTMASKLHAAGLSQPAFPTSSGFSGVPSFHMGEAYSMPGHIQHESVHGTPAYHAVNESAPNRVHVHMDEPLRPMEGPMEGERTMWGKVKHKYQSMSPGAQKKLKIGGAIGGALALGGAGYAAYKHEKAAEVALLINEGFSVDEAVALVGE